MITLLFIFFYTALIAQEPDRMHAAEQYFEAKEYDRALEIYDQMLETPLTAWQKAVVEYNKGTVLLAQGLTAKALEQFQSIALGTQPNPLLARRIQTNEAIGLYLQAKKFAPTSLNQVEMNLFDGQEALGAVAAAMQADCDLVKAEGGSHCVQPYDLLELKSLVKEHMAKLYADIKPFLEKDIAPSDGVPYLIVSLRKLLAMIDFLDRKTLNENQKKSYIELGLKKAMGWQPLWDSLQKQMKKESQEIQTLFGEASDLFHNGVQSLQKRSLVPTRHAWQGALEKLDMLVGKIVGVSPTMEMLRKLLAFYQFAYAQIPLQESTVLNLQEEQKKVLEIIAKEFKESLEKAQADIEITLQSLKDNDSRTGRFYLEEGRFQVVAILEQMRQKTKLAPIDILESVVEFQQHALSLNRLSHMASKARRADLLKRVESAQQKVVALSETFHPAVLAWQEAAFNASATDQTSPSRCQMHPWDEVLPLFNQGLLSAQQAVDVVSANALIYQGEALSKFRLAEAKMRKPIADFKGTCEGQAAAKPSQKQEKTQTPKPEPSLNELMRNIMQMDEEDRLPKQEPSIQMGGSKPW